MEISFIFHSNPERDMVHRQGCKWTNRNRTVKCDFYDFVSSFRVFEIGEYLLIYLACGQSQKEAEKNW